MDQSTTQSTSNTKTRDDSIQAAKKKLKTFRAKQAQVAKRSSSSSAAPASASQRNRASLILSQAAAQTVSNAIEQASDLAQSSTANSNSNSHVRTHSRTASRAGHGRGHSRGGSISITAQGMANLVNSSLNQTTNPTSNTNQQPSSRNSMRNSGIFSFPSSTSMPAVASTTSNRTSFIASTPASTHVRSHSRTGSRSTLGRSRPASLIGLGAINHGEGVTLAVELPPDASLLGGMGRSEDWKDINNGNDGTKRNSNRLSDASSSRKSWNSISNNNNNSNRLSAPSSRRTSERPISGSSVTSNKSTTSSNGTATGNSPNPTSSSSLASPNRLSFNFIDRNNLNSSPQPPSTSLSSNPRRQSRHGRQASVSTKRESMEIMGGLGYGGDVRTSKRFSSSNNRMSGIQSASILFGGEPDQSGKGGRRDWDMRGLKVNDNEEDGDDRLTALEKLEGRSRSVSPNPPVTSFSEPPRSPSARHQQQDQNQRSSLVQLPSFDDVHGDEAMDKRKSLTLLEKNEQSTSQQSGPARINAIWDDSSNEDLLPSSRSSGNLSQSHSDPSIKTRPMSMFGDSSPALEGLTTLMEEEEEEEASPIREKSSDSNLSSNDSLLEHGESSEDAALKRARRASLTPRPLKLKSRPASLFISPAMRASTSGLGSNNNTSQMSTSSSLQSLPEIAASPRTAKQAKEWSFSRAQQNAVEAKEGSIDDLASPPITARAFPSISSAPVASNGEMTPPASSTTPTGPRGIKPLRLASSSSAGISSPSANANVDSPTAMNGAFSFPQNASSATSSSHGSQSSIASTTSAGTAKRNSLLQLGSLGRPSLEGREEYNAPSISPVGMGGMRRSSIIYKTSKNSDPTVNTPTSSNANVSHSPFSPNESSTISPSSSTSSNLNNVSSASFEELKAKANRDASLLETSRKQVERLQKELLIETERSCKEYSELERRSAAVYSELERWSAEEKRGLGSRIEALEMDISKSLEKIKELEKSKSESEEEMKERLEEFESERESWRDDEEGWRTRCSDAEKSSMKERARVEEEKRKNESLRKRNKALTLALEKAGIEVPQMEEGSGFIGEDLTLDLATVLRSPALGSGAMRSPALGSAGGFENSSGYFSPRSFNGANGKTSQDFADPPTTVKLLAEMRQQIFNLAGSLEHERKEHLKAREEADNLKVSLESVQQQSSQSEENDSSISSTLDGPLSSNSHDDNLLRRSTSNPRIGSAGSSSAGQRTKKHVFAYDSSMGSFGQSAGSNSIRSQNVSISMSTSTDETGFEDESLNHGKEAALTQEQKIQQQQQPPLSSSSSVASNLTAMPSSSSLNDLNSNDEMVGLGVAMGGLQTLTEEEEAEAVDDDEVGLFDVVNSNPKDDQFEDLESGGLMNDGESVVDDEQELVDAQEQVQDDDFDLEAGVAGDYHDDEEEDLESNMPPTPALDHDDQYESTPPPSYRSSSNHPNSTNQNHGSSGGSLESNGPASPVQEALEEQDEEFYDEEDDEEEEEEDDYPQSSTPPGEPRPEFLREWSFSRATAAVQASRSMKRKSSSQKKSKKVKKFSGKKNVKNVDIEDFFGILCDHSLPPLPPPPEALEMPPVYIEPQQQQSLSNFPFGMIGSNQSYDKAPRASMRVATTINNPLLANNGVGAKRPPVARSAYVRESFESHQNESVSSNNSHQMNSSPHGSSASSNSNNSSGSLSGMGIGNSMAMATTAAGLGSKALSRMSLQGLTSAFSGLGGYLTSQSGAAVNVAANATRMCNGNGELSPVHGLNENGGDSVSWIEAKRRESSDDDDGDDLHPAVRKALEKNPNNNNNGFGSVSSNQSSNSSIQPKFQRRFLIKDQVRKPIATPVWQLDFETATLGRGAGPLIQL